MYLDKLNVRRASDENSYIMRNHMPITRETGQHTVGEQFPSNFDGDFHGTLSTHGIVGMLPISNA